MVFGPTFLALSGWRRCVVHQPLHHVVIYLREERADYVLDLVEAVGAEQHRLVVRDVVGLDTHSTDVQRPEVGLFDLLDLPVRGEQAGAVGADFAVLAYHTELKENQKTFDTNSSASVVCTRRAA